MESMENTADIVSISYKESYKSNLAIFQNLDRSGVQQFGSQKMTKKDAQRSRVLIDKMKPEVDEVIAEPPSSVRRSCFHGNGKYFLEQSLYGTVRMNSMSRSFVTAFNPKSWPGVFESLTSRKKLNVEEEEEELKEEEEEVKRKEDVNDEGVSLNPSESPVASKNCFHGDYHQVKHNPSYVSDNDDDDETERKVTSGEREVPLDFRSSSLAEGQKFNGASVTSDYDSVSTGSIGSSSSSENIESALGTSDAPPAGGKVQTKTADEKSRRAPVNDMSLVGQNDNGNNKNIRRSNDEHSATTRQPEQRSAANQSHSTGATTTKSPESITGNAWEIRTFAKDSLDTKAIEAEQQHRKQTNGAPTSRVDDLDLQSSRLERGQSTVTERETLTSIRQRARSSMICRRREKLTSKAEDVVREFRQQQQEAYEGPPDKPSDVRKTLENFVASDANVSSLVRSKSFLDGVRQSIKVERKETEIRVVERRYLSAIEKNALDGSGRGVSYATELPVTGSVTREFSEIFMDLEGFQVEIRNVVRCESVSEVQKPPASVDIQDITPASERKDDKVTSSRVQPDVCSTCVHGPSAASSPPPLDLLQTSDVFKSKTVLLVKSTIVDMSLSGERKLIFQELARKFSSEQPEAEGRSSVPEGSERLRLSACQFALLCQKVKDLTEVEDKRLINYSCNY